VIAAEAIAGLGPSARDGQAQYPRLHLLPSADRQRRPDRGQGEGGGLHGQGRQFPFIGNGKAIALGEAEGFIKTVFDAKTGELLGAHMIGAEVTELIQGYVVGKTLETTEAELDLMNTVFPHPTLSEMMHEALLACLWPRAAPIPCLVSTRSVGTPQRPRGQLTW
jgi:dihydrolipoamide dehydrogenase